MTRRHRMFAMTPTSPNRIQAADGVGRSRQANAMINAPIAAKMISELPTVW